MTEPATAPSCTATNNSSGFTARLRSMSLRGSLVAVTRPHRFQSATSGSVSDGSNERIAGSTPAAGPAGTLRPAGGGDGGEEVAGAEGLGQEARRPRGLDLADVLARGLAGNRDDPRL